MITAIEMKEFDDRLIEGYELSLDERAYLQSLATIKSPAYWEKRFIFDELRTGLRIRSQSWVGVIELERVRISIRPKFDQGFCSLLSMISFTEKLPFYSWHQTSAEWDSNNLMELLVRYFIDQLEQLWHKGLFKDYVTEEDNLKQFRGSPDLLQNMRVNYGLPSRIYCRYDELVTNTPENQVILLALEVASKFRLNQATCQKVNRYRSEFKMLCEAHQGNDWPIFHYNRLNQHYEPVHVLARYIVEQLAVNDIYQTSRSSFFSMMIDMNQLFEDFVGTYLKRYLPNKYKVESQRRITDAIQVGGSSYRHMIPDLLVQDTTTKQIRVLDVKYKNYGAKNVENADLYQLAFYAQYFNREHQSPHHSVIVYPRFKDNPEDGAVQIELLRGTPAEGYLSTKCLRIESVLELIATRNEVELRELAVWLVAGNQTYI
ncbi:MAG: McrC family protein [Paenibacillus sp.]|nr:McrC family protein [Paenibacillus sp.]